MQSERNKKIGVLIIFTSILVSILLFNFFHLFGVKLDYSNTSLLLKTILSTIFIPLGLYFGLQFTNGKKVANQIAGGVVIFLATTYILGFVLH